jgi:hypothetical protein
MTSVDTRTKSLLETIKDTREHLHEELGLIIQGETNMTKTLTANTTRRALEVKRAEADAWAESGKEIGTGGGAEKPSKFNGTTSWPVFWHQFETVAEHNC